MTPHFVIEPENRTYCYKYSNTSNDHNEHCSKERITYIVSKNNNRKGKIRNNIIYGIKENQWGRRDQYKR